MTFLRFFTGKTNDSVTLPILEKAQEVASTVSKMFRLLLQQQVMLPAMLHKMLHRLLKKPFRVDTGMVMVIMLLHGKVLIFGEHHTKVMPIRLHKLNVVKAHSINMSKVVLVISNKCNFLHWYVLFKKILFL